MKRAIRVPAVSLFLASGLLLAACGGESQADPEPSPSVSETPGASSSPTSTKLGELGPIPIPSDMEPPSAEDAPKVSIFGYTASELREMPLNDYLALSAIEREPLITAMLEQSADWAGSFGEDWQGDTSALYKYNPLDIASEDNSAKEIAMQHLYWMQLGLMQTEDLDTSGTFDPDIATKALAGGFSQPGYVTGRGQDTLTNGMNAEFDYWKSAFPSLDALTSHDYTQTLTNAEFVDEGNVRNNYTGERHKVVSISFTTEALPETLADSYIAGTTTVGNLSFVWNEDLNRWQAYNGLTENRPAGWK